MFGPGATHFGLALHRVGPHKTAMFPIGGGEFPSDNATLHAALAHGIAPLGVAPAAIALDGAFPSFAVVRVDLTGARFQRDLRPVTALGEPGSGFFARVVAVNAAPANFEGVPFQFSLRAEDCVFEFGKDGSGTGAGILKNCAGGAMEVTLGIADVEAALMKFAGEAAAAHGASVQSIRVSVENEGPRRLAMTATATAKAMMFSAALTIRGRLAIDEEFGARLSDIACTGEGMIANLAAAQLRPRLAAWEGFRFPLASVVPPGFALADVVLDANPTQGIRASFRLTGGARPVPGAV